MARTRPGANARPTTACLLPVGKSRHQPHPKEKQAMKANETLQEMSLQEEGNLPRFHWQKTRTIVSAERRWSAPTAQSSASAKSSTLTRRRCWPIYSHPQTHPPSTTLSSPSTSASPSRYATSRSSADARATSSPAPTSNALAGCSWTGSPLTKPRIME